MWRMTALILLGVILAGALYVFGLHIGPLHVAGLRDANDRLRTEVAEMVKAAALAMAAQDTLDLAAEATHSALAKESADEYRQVVESARSAVSRYAAAHRVPASPAICPGAGLAADLPTDPPAPSDPGDPAAMVAITREDLDHLATGAMQASSSQRFFQSLIEEGVAIPIPEF